MTADVEGEVCFSLAFEGAWGYSPSRTLPLETKLYQLKERY